MFSVIILNCLMYWFCCRLMLSFYGRMKATFVLVIVLNYLESSFFGRLKSWFLCHLLSSFCGSLKSSMDVAVRCQRCACVSRMASCPTGVLHRSTSWRLSWRRAADIDDTSPRRRTLFITPKLCKKGNDKINILLVFN